jgi:AraC family transcriptional regulator
MVSPRGKTPHNFTTFESLQLPASILPNRRALTHGPGVSIYCDRQRPKDWPEHELAATKILIALEPARCCVTWLGATGQEHSRVIGQGDLVILAPGIRHTKSWMNEAGIIMLYLSESWLRQFSHPAIEGVMIESFSELNLRDPLIGGLTNEIRQTCIPLRDDSRAHAVALGLCLASRVVQSIARGRGSSRSVVRRLSGESMQRVANYVHAHLADRIPVATLAKEARLSPSHFNVLFKATTDLTCEQYILRTRLARAKALIETGTYTVGQVAHMTGFSDHSHLTVRFTKLFGAPPRSFLPKVRTA